MEPPAVLTKITDTVPKNNARKQFCTDPCLQPECSLSFHYLSGSALWAAFNRALPEAMWWRSLSCPSLCALCQEMRHRCQHLSGSSLCVMRSAATSQRPVEAQQSCVTPYTHKGGDKPLTSEVDHGRVHLPGSRPCTAFGCILPGVLGLLV
eukprot:scaffold54591_cov23-Tisochrysis_lutea.AAC.2